MKTKTTNKLLLILFIKVITTMLDISLTSCLKSYATKQQDSTLTLVKYQNRILTV